MKILIAGLGGIGQRHARNLRALLGDGAELIAWRVRGLSRVINPSLQADDTRSVEIELGIQPFSDIREALRQKPDAAFICNPTAMHLAAAQACAEAGCHLFLEKPVSHSLDGLDQLIATVDRFQLIASVGYQLRFHPCLRALREALGQFGRILAIRAMVGEYLPAWHAYEDYRQMYAASAALGGGVILSQIHEFDYLYSLFGLPASVYSAGGHWSSLDLDVEDTASTLMSYPAFAVSLHQDYLQKPARRQCEAICEGGTILADFAGLKVTTPAAVNDFAGFERNQLFIDQTEHFLACLAGRESPIVDLRAGIQSLRMALAAKESIASGQPVRLTYGASSV